MATFNVINHQELSGSATTVTHSSISGSYDHLYGIVNARSDQSAWKTGMMIQFNNDTGANYGFTDIQAASGTPSTYGQTNATAIGYPPIPGASATANAFSCSYFYIPDYTSTAKFTQLIFVSVAPSNSGTSAQWEVKQTAAIWKSTAAITEIDFTLNGGDDFVQYSTFTLYGINGAA